MFFVQLAYLIASLVGAGLMAALAWVAIETLLGEEFMLPEEYETEDDVLTEPTVTGGWDLDILDVVVLGLQVADLEEFAGFRARITLPSTPVVLGWLGPEPQPLTWASDGPGEYSFQYAA